MNIIICGAGRVGFIAKLLTEQNHSITVIVSVKIFKKLMSLM